jgi:2,3-diketo-5-methylthio-1-phosphopentane phosphatase
MSIPNGALPNSLPALRTNPKYIFFTDFDGTITLQDSNDFMTDNLGFGVKKRQAGNADVLFSRSSFRDSFQSMMDSINTPFDKCIQILLENIKLDPGFKEFYQWARENNIPVVVLSGGMEPIIRALLVHLIGNEALDMQIVSNDVAPQERKDINDEGGWKIAFRDDR